MGRRWVLWIAFTWPAAIVAACVVDIPDVVDASANDGSPNDVNASDVDVSDAPADIVIAPTCDAACGAPAGFAPAYFALDRKTACPSNLQLDDLAADPGSVGPSGCPCDCSVTTPPTCTPETLHHFHGSSLCSTQGQDVVVDGGCNVLDAALYIDQLWSMPPVPPSDVGKCASNPTPNVGAVPSTPSRLCIDPTCASSCTAPSGFTTCFIAPGAVKCPTSLTTHHVGNVGLSCDACSACSIDVDGGCEGTFTLYSDVSCANKLVTENVDGGCTSNGTAYGLQAYSVKYAPVAAGIECTPGTSTGGAGSLSQELTVCCP